MITELLIGLAGVFGVFAVRHFITGTKKAIFKIWLKALKDTLAELNLEEEGHFEIFYGILKKLHQADFKTSELEDVMLDELTKKQNP